MNRVPKIQDADLNGKVVLVRVDHNVVKKGKIKDPYRIEMSIPTIIYILKKGGKPILMSHVGRPRDKAGNFEITPNDCVRPILDFLSHKYELVGKIPQHNRPAPGEPSKGFMQIDDSIKPLIQELKEGKIDYIYLPNTRFYAGEEDKGELKKLFGKQLADLADIFVNDAFGSWQPHASTVEPIKYIPSYAGLLMQKELRHLEDIFEPKHPLTAVVAGSKFDTKIKPLEVLIQNVDHLILGGVIFNAYIAVKYGLTIKGISPEDMEVAQGFVKMSEKYPNKVVEPAYIVESDSLEAKVEGSFRTHKVADLKRGTALNYILDIGKDSFEESALIDVIMKSSTIFVNAVMGLTPLFTEGTMGMYSLIDKNKNALKLFGGGDTLHEFNNLLPEMYKTAVDCENYYFFTGGGTILTAIEQGSPYKLDTVQALINK